MINQYVIEKELGRGSYATVHLGYDKNTGVKYAIKELNKAILLKKRGKTAYEYGLEELKVL
jgi:serine/threonine protein kinase